MLSRVGRDRHAQRRRVEAGRHRARQGGRFRRGATRGASCRRLRRRAAAFGSGLRQGRACEAARGQTALVQTCLALAGLPPLADPFEAIWRLSAADGLMKSGVAPAAIIEALAPISNAVERAYNPDQPRVPAGNGRISGQWTSEDEAASDRGSVETSPVDARTQSKKPIQTADNSSNWAQYLDPIGPADAAQYNGAAPNAQHQAGVDLAYPVDSHDH